MILQILCVGLENLKVWSTLIIIQFCISLFSFIDSYRFHKQQFSEREITFLKLQNLLKTFGYC